MQTFTHTINGESVESPSTFDVIDPSTGQPFAKAPQATQEQVDRAVRAARAALPGWSATPLEDRKALLKKAADVLIKKMDEIAEVLVKEQGKPLMMAKGEVMFAVQSITSIVGYEIPVVVIKDTKEVRTEQRRKPVGVVAGITPWNFPVFIAIAKIAPAVFTGCTVIVKPSPFTPLTTLMIGTLFRDIFPPGVVNVVSGTDDVGKWLVVHPEVNKISFTGSIPTGKKILEASGNDLKRVFVHESKYNEFCEVAKKSVEQFKFGNGFEAGVTHGPINNQMQYKRVCELVEDAKAHGANILCGGAPQGTNGYFYPATVVTGIKEGVRLVDEEQFGPVIPIMSYSTDEEAVARANSTKFGLSGSVWSSDANAATEMASKLECGTAWVNTHLEMAGDAPFGGCKWSGIGRENGIDAILAGFTETQVVMVAKL